VVSRLFTAGVASSIVFVSYPHITDRFQVYPAGRSKFPISRIDPDSLDNGSATRVVTLPERIVKFIAPANTGVVPNTAWMKLLKDN
jgi:hypothetical protein